MELPFFPWVKTVIILETVLLNLGLQVKYKSNILISAAVDGRLGEPIGTVYIIVMRLMHV